MCRSGFQWDGVFWVAQASRVDADSEGHGALVKEPGTRLKRDGVEVTATDDEEEPWVFAEQYLGNGSSLRAPSASARAQPSRWSLEEAAK